MDGWLDGSMDDGWMDGWASKIIAKLEYEMSRNSNINPAVQRLVCSCFQETALTSGQCTTKHLVSLPRFQEQCFLLSFVCETVMMIYKYRMAI